MTIDGCVIHLFETIFWVNVMFNPCEKRNFTVRQLLLTPIITLAAALAQPAWAQDDGVPPQDQTLDGVTVLNLADLEFTEPGQSVDLQFRIDGFADECTLRSPRDSAPVRQPGVRGTGEFTIQIVSPSDLAQASTGRLRYRLQCNKGEDFTGRTVSVPYNIYGVAITMSPGTVASIDASTRSTGKRSGRSWISSMTIRPCNEFKVVMGSSSRATRMPSGLAMALRACLLNPPWG